MIVHSRLTLIYTRLSLSLSHSLLALYVLYETLYVTDCQVPLNSARIHTSEEIIEGYVQQHSA